MAIAERVAEGSREWPFLSFFLRKKVPFAEKPQVLALRMEDVFMSNSIGFTRFGEELYGTLIRRAIISDAGMSSDRRSEVILEVGERCKKLGISKDSLSLIGEQFAGLIKKRSLEINNVKQVSGSQK
jgi:hypothetical protein